jgi:hypothetical protein
MGDPGLPVPQLSAEPENPQLTAHGRGFRPYSAAAADAVHEQILRITDHIHTVGDRQLVTASRVVQCAEIDSFTRDELTARRR